MLYAFVKILSRLALKLFCRQVTFSDRALLKSEGPLILACNHPNSFFDAILLGSLFERPVHFLARGDAFRKPLVRKFLSALRMIPIYRLSEGREYLALNDSTFERCQEVLLQGGILLIFSEGLCKNQWDLRPLKKGTARIALEAWKNPVLARNSAVLPVGLNYNSFSGFGKRILVHFGEKIREEDIPAELSMSERILHFNTLLAAQLQHSVLSAHGNDELAQMLISNHTRMPGSSHTITSLKDIQARISPQQSEKIVAQLKPPALSPANAASFAADLAGIILLALPAAAGWLLHIPYYLLVKRFVVQKTNGTVFYDSVLFGLLLLTYPLYWMLLNIAGMIWLDHWYVLLFIPFLAWATLIWRDCLNRSVNFLRLYSREDGRAFVNVFYSAPSSR